jgi:hypothetical protein
MHRVEWLLSKVHNSSKELSSTRLAEQACLSRGVSVSIICISSGFDGLTMHDVIWLRLLRCGWTGAHHFKAIALSAIFRVRTSERHQKHGSLQPSCVWAAASCLISWCCRLAAIVGRHPLTMSRPQPPLCLVPSGYYVTVAKKRVLKCLILLHATTRDETFRPVHI